MTTSFTQDPYIKQLLAATNNIAETIVTKINTDKLELQESLLQQFWPQILRPFPATTIMRFKPRPGQLTQTESIARNTLIQSGAIGSAPQHCTFRTTMPVKLNPLRISKTTIHQKQIIVELQFEPGTKPSHFDLNQFVFYLNCASPQREKLHDFLINQVVSIQLQSNQRIITQTPQVTAEPCGFNPQESLLPRENRHIPNYLFREYCILPEKFLFIRINGVNSSLINSTNFQLIINGKTTTPIINEQEPLLLHCTPAINLQTIEAEPITIKHYQHEQKITLDGTEEANSLIYDILPLTALNTNTKTKYSLTPFYHHSKTNNLRYKITKRHNNHYCQLERNDADDYIISSQITICQGFAPHSKLMPNSITRLKDTLALKTTVTNLTTPTQLFEPPTESPLLHLLAKPINLQLNSLLPTEQLHDFLQLNVPTAQTDYMAHITAIANCSTDVTNIVYQGCMHQLLTITLQIEERSFNSIAAIGFFTTILHHQFSQLCHINTLVRTITITLPTKQKIVCNHRNGVQYPV